MSPGREYREECVTRQGAVCHQEGSTERSVSPGREYRKQCDFTLDSPHTTDNLDWEHGTFSIECPSKCIMAGSSGELCKVAIKVYIYIFSIKSQSKDRECYFCFITKSETTFDFLELIKSFQTADRSQVMVGLILLRGNLSKGLKKPFIKKSLFKNSIPKKYLF